MGADRGHQRRDMDEIARPAGDLDVVDVRLVADDQFERGVDLMAGGGVVALDQHGARALLDHDQRAGEHRGRLVAGRGKHQMDRPLDGRALGDVNDGAVAHQRGVERDHALALGRHDLAEIGIDQRIAGRQRLRHRADGQAGRQIGEVGQVPARTCRRRTRCAAHPCRRSACRHPWRAPWRRRPARRRAASPRAISARRSVYFHSSTRRCGRPSASKRAAAASRSATTLRSPGSLAFAAVIGLGQRLLGVGLHAAEFGVHDASAASPWNCA